MNLIRIISMIGIMFFSLKSYCQKYNFIDTLGKKQGEWRIYYDKNKSKIKEKYFYVDDKPDGKVLFFNKKGALTTVYFISNGNFLLHKTYYTRGPKKGKVKRVQGLKIDKTLSKYFYLIDSSDIFSYSHNQYDEKGFKIGKWHEFVISKIGTSIYKNYYAIGEYKKGLKEGEWYYYNYDGKQLVYKCNYTFNSLSGEFYTFDTEGNIIMKHTYNGGVLDGPFISYFKNGKIEFKGMMKQGYRTGEFTRYNKKGEIIEYKKNVNLSD